MEYQVYHGVTRHRRHFPKVHHFSYKLTMFYFDIADIPSIFKNQKNISVEKFNWFSWYRKNYLKDYSVSLDSEARKLVHDQFGIYPQGKIYLLTHLACLGYCFNPISLYLCYAPDGKHIDFMIVEVTNTPWKEKHHYILDFPRDNNKNFYCKRLEKKHHVSPFMAMNQKYLIHFKHTEKKLILHISSFQDKKKYFDASLFLESSADVEHIVNKVSMFRLMTYKTILAIHWQALKLFLKKIPVYSHPRHHKDNCRD